MMTRITLSPDRVQHITDFWFLNIQEPISVCEYYRSLGWDLIKELGCANYSLPKDQYLFFLMTHAD